MFRSSLLVLIFCHFINLAHGMKVTECNKLSSQAESYSAKNNYDKALEIAKNVVAGCKPAPYSSLVLAGKITLRQKKNPKESLKYFDQAMKQGPDYYMGFLNASAAHMELGNLNKSIEFAKTAIQKAKTKSNKLKGKYNLALAYYKKAAPNNNKDIYKLGYKLFQETKALDIFKASSLYFMGLYEETIPLDEKLAKKSYQEACNSGHQQSCASVVGVSSRVRKKNYKPAKDYSSLDLTELANEMKKCYKAKYNMEDSAVDSTVKSITGSMDSLPEGQRKKMYIQTLNSIGCKA